MNYETRRDRIGAWGDAGMSFREGLTGPIERARHGAINQFLVDTQCVLLGALESGSRDRGATPLANAWAFLRGANGCYAGSAPSYTKTADVPPQFEGGQCDGTRYELDYLLVVNGVQLTVGTQFPYGPISEGYITPDPNNGSRVLAGFDGRPSVNVPVQFIQIASIAVSDTINEARISSLSPFSGPDDCGSLPPTPGEYPPGQELPPPPSLGDIIAPGRTETVPVLLPGGTVPISIEIGDLIYLGGDGVAMDVDGIPHRFAPDGGLDAFPYGDSLADGEESPEDILEEVRDELTQDFVGTSTWQTCYSVVAESPYEGKGLAGIKAMLEAQLDTVNTGVSEFCELIEPPQPQDTLIDDDTFPQTEFPAFRDFAVPVDALRLTVTINGFVSAYAVRNSGNDSLNDVQGRFAVISAIVTAEGNDVVAWTENQYYRGGVYGVAGIASQGMKIRVSLREGTSAIVRYYK